jgi:hypothetical protein
VLLLVLLLLRGLELLLLGMALGLVTRGGTRWGRGVVTLLRMSLVSHDVFGYL